MRLKEPLYGYRIAQMHFLVHLGLAINMYLIQNDWIEFNEHMFKTTTKMFKSDYFREHPDLCIGYQQRNILLEEKWGQPMPLYNRDICKALFVTHILSAILILFEKITKKYGVLLVCGNFVRTVPINLLYLTLLFYSIYKSRLDCKYDDQKLYEYVVEVWLEFEIRIFFCWIFSSMLFLFFVYFTKFNSNWKELDERLAIEDMWESKNSKDILHYFKFENDVFSVIISFMLSDIEKVHRKYKIYDGFIDYDLVCFIALRFGMAVLFLK